MSSPGTQTTASEEQSLSRSDISPVSPVSPASPAPKKQSVPKPGHKFVKVHNKDGKIITVQRKMSPEELAASEAVKATAHVTPPVKADDATPNLDASSKETATVSAKEIPNPGAESNPIESGATISHEEALDEQKVRFRQGRMRKFGRSLGLGVATIVGSSMPSIDLDTQHEGDVEVHGYDDPSDDEYDLPDHTGHDHNHEDVHATISTGAMANAVAASMMTKGEEKPPTVTIKGVENGDKSNEKSTYGLTMKKLEADEEKRKAELQDRPLRRRIATIGFYFLAALAVILPCLFLILGIFISRMDGKSVRSHWRYLPEANKVAVSAWPIVFAAVAAQAFKSYATFKVERGIKLMQLEQLVGANSFGNALKQPLMLRRVNMLAFGLFVIWCLSPLGSQALQRSFVTRLQSGEYTTNISYVDTGKPNQLFSSTSSQELTRERSTKLQLVSAYFNSMFLPRGAVVDAFSIASSIDSYGNPWAVNYDVYSKEETPQLPNSQIQGLTFASFFGIPYISPPLNQSDPPEWVMNSNIAFDPNSASATVYEDKWTMYMNYSYYNLTCGDWDQRSATELATANFNFSDFGDAAMIMTDPNGVKKNFLAYASQNRELNIVDNEPAEFSPNASQIFSYIECTHNRVFYTVGWECYRSVSLQSASYFTPPPGQCQTIPPMTVWRGPADDVDDLADFSHDFMQGVQQGSYQYLASGMDTYLNSGVDVSNPINRSQASADFNLSRDTSPDDFRWLFGLLFNSWITLGYCPECIDTLCGEDGECSDTTSNSGVPPGLTDYYTNTTVTVQYKGYDSVYKVNKGWLAGVFVTALLLVAIGIISLLFESMAIAPDTLGYISTAARNSKYLYLPPTTSDMSGPERAVTIGHTTVMMQDVKAKADVGKIVLGNKHDAAMPLKPGRVYR